MSGIHTTCPYCGVGCGIVAQPDGTITADPVHPSNRGRLCSKGAALGATLDDSTRLLHPMIGGRAASWDDALGLVAAQFRKTIAKHGPDSVAFYVSGQCLTEDYYVANKLMKGFIGSANIDTNSRLCMASSVAGHVRAFGEDIVPAIYEDWDEADLVVLVGSNAAWCHPVLHQRLLAAKAAHGTKIVVIDPRRTATADAADLHVPIASGSDIALFNALLVYLNEVGKVDRLWVRDHVAGLDEAIAAATIEHVDMTDWAAEQCGIDPELLETFFDLFARTERVLTVFSQGVNQSSAGTDKVNAIINVHLATGRIGRAGMGPFSVTGQPNAMGGREVGGLANQLAAHKHFDDPADRAALTEFWNAPALAPAPGLKAVDMFEAVADGRIKAIWIVATNPAASMPRAAKVREALAACPFVVVSDCWPTDTTGFADVLLPAAGWGEKDGTVTNSERLISRQRAFRPAPGEAQPDWWQFAEVGRRMGWARQFTWTSAAAVFREHATLSGHRNHRRHVFDIGALGTLDDAAYDALQPVRWPVPAGAVSEGGRLFAQGGFPTEDGRARAVPVAWSGRPVPEGNHSVLLNTGRVRDQWHTMTRTGLAPNLMTHTPEPVLAINPADATAYGIETGGLVRLTTGEGSILLRAGVTHNQRRGEVYAPMHWTDQFSSNGPIDGVVGARRDPISGQPELKATPSMIEPVPATFYGVLLRRSSFAAIGPLGLRTRPPPGDRQGGATSRPDEPVRLHPDARPGKQRSDASGTSQNGEIFGHSADCSLGEICHWVRIPLAEGQLYRLTGLSPMPEGKALARYATVLLGAPNDSELVEISDPKRGVFRVAALADGAVEAALFLARHPASLPAEAALVPLLGAPVPDDARSRLLAGRLYDKAAAEGPRICACFGVTRDAIRHAVVTHRLRTTAEIGVVLGAGTNCGSCIPNSRRFFVMSARLQPEGRATLVGCGPGDPDLLTVKAVKAIESADVLLFDALIDPAILDFAPAAARRIDVGKRCGRHTMNQAAINALIVRLARSGAHVVRLKGGDPFVFGRGGEELASLLAAQVPVTVVPGVTAACAAAASLQVPLTHRALSRSVHFVTLHGAEGAVPAYDWLALVRSGGTIAAYMATRTLPLVAAQLMAAGMAASTPAVAIENASRAGERRLFGTIADLPQALAQARAAAEFAGPTLVLIGAVVGLVAEAGLAERLAA